MKEWWYKNWTSSALNCSLDIPQNRSNCKIFLFIFLCLPKFLFWLHPLGFFKKKPKFYDLPSSLLYLFSIKRLHYNELFSTAYLLVFFCWKKGLEWHLLVNCARYFCCYTLHMILLHKLFRTHDFLYCACHVFDTILLIEKKKSKAILVGNIVQNKSIQ